MIQLSTLQFLALVGLSGAQLGTIAGVFFRLGRVGARQDDLQRRIEALEKGQTHEQISRVLA